MRLVLYRASAAVFGGWLALAPMTAVLCSMECARPSPPPPTEATEHACHKSAPAPGASVSTPQHDCTTHGVSIGMTIQGLRLIASGSDVGAIWAPSHGQPFNRSRSAALQSHAPPGRFSFDSAGSLQLRI